MTPLLWVLLGIGGALALVWLVSRGLGFGSQRPDHYAQSEPYFAVKDVLSGELLCDGVIYGPLGRVVSRFAADFDVRWDGNRGRMIEHFRYDSGNTQDREWWLELGDDGALKADASDLVDTGHGRQSGATLLMRYRIRLPDAAGGHVLNVTDWMYLTPDGVIVNRSQFRKFGIKVAELIATIRKREAQ